ncbi:MAG: hypothetical protein WC378_18665 [Opitutaceae bacterium]
MLALFALNSGAAQSNDLRLELVTSEVASPCAGRPLAFDLARGPDDSVVLAWVEQGGDGAQSLRMAAYSALRSAWSAPRTIASSSTLLHPVDGTELTLSADEAGRMAVAWVGAAHSGAKGSEVFATLSEDGGATWTKPQMLSAPGLSASQPSFAWRQGGGWLATWLEASGETGLQVCVREVGQAGILRPEGAVAHRAATTAIASFPDGTDLIAFRAFRPDEGVDSWAIRRFENIWQAPQRLGRDGLTGVAPARDPIRLSVSPPRIAAAWFTAADDEPRIVVASSPDAGARWTRASRTDLGHPVGAPDLVLLSDGSQLVAWIEGSGGDPSLPPGILVRRYSAGGGSVRPAHVVKDEPGNFPASPRLAVLRDQREEPVVLLMAFEQGAASAKLRFLHLRLPSPTALAQIDTSCNCNTAALPGFPIRGNILSIDAVHSRLHIRHDSIPGIFRPGEIEVQVSAAAIGAVREGRGIMGRIERRDGTWHMSDIRTFVLP